MKNFIFGIVCLSVTGLSCSKKPDTSAVAAVDESRATYDTTAIDSFSAGATSVDVMRQIRMSSQRYQDSVKAAVKLQEQEKKITEELEKENKKKAEEEKKKSSENNKDKEQKNQ
ncbi:hypothetical protein [Chryseobacterium sp. Leaf394]|uniref:hypothetical protein n=1 Tax=Chryseobacterium sp. Leaf394 TaxID=1736361 RepID=UPI0006FE4C82|nr:hypothetical protein [Chryseobacterium sp. Leaf394]KQS89965.1 hypothetical protein ASG21_13405 [Chryseobacterium sp. Leaf394]